MCPHVGRNERICAFERNEIDFAANASKNDAILGNYNYLVVGDIKSAFNRFLMCTPIPFEFPCMLRL